MKPKLACALTAEEVRRLMPGGKLRGPGVPAALSLAVADRLARIQRIKEQHQVLKARKP